MIARNGIDRVIELERENKRLAEALANANEQAERFEREWYLRGDEIERLQEVSDEMFAAMTATPVPRPTKGNQMNHDEFPEELLDDCRKGLGLFPHDTGMNLVKGDPYYWQAIKKRWGELNVMNACAFLNDKHKSRINPESLIASHGDKIVINDLVRKQLIALGWTPPKTSYAFKVGDKGLTRDGCKYEVVAILPKASNDRVVIASIDDGRTIYCNHIDGSYRSNGTESTTDLLPP